jgi:hypothetical protein
MRIGLLAAVLSLGFSSVTWSQVPFPAGGEFRVNTFTPSYQTHPLVAVGPRGDFLVAWTSFDQDGDSAGVYAQRYDALGAPQGGEFRVNTQTLSVQYAFGAAADAGGNYVVVWESSGPGQDGSGRGVVGRVFSSSGVPLTGEFLMNVFTNGPQAVPAVAALPGGGFVVVWQSQQDGSSYGIIGRRFDSRGGPLGGEFGVNTFTPGSQSAPRVASDAAGNFVVVWHSAAQDGSLLGVFGRRFDASGTPLSGEFQVNVTAANDQRYPVVSTVSDGRFVVVWEDSTRDGNRYGIFGRRYDAAGNPLSGEFQINVYTTDHQHTPTVAAFGNGSFVAAWYSQDQLMPFPNQDVFSRQYGSTGVPGPEFLINTFTPNKQFLADADADDVGNLVVTWDSTGQDGSLNGIFARRFGGLVPSALTVDATPISSSNGNGVFEAGEMVVVKPSWRNVNGTTLAFDGVASAFAGPAGAIYTIADGDAGYGSVPSGTVTNCGFVANCYAMRVVAGVRPAAHWDAQFREDIVPAALGQSKAWSLHMGDTFIDVPRTSGFYRFVETVLHTGVMPGCSGTLFCPTVAVFRDRMAQYVLKSKEPHFVPPACVPGQEMFADVPASSQFCRWVQELARRGVVAGCGGGNYCPSQGVSRQQLAVYLLATLEGTAYAPPPCGAPVFNDVPASSSFCPWVEELYRRGVVAGCGGGGYCPTLSVTRQQMSVFLSVTFGLTLYGP